MLDHGKSVYKQAQVSAAHTPVNVCSCVQMFKSSLILLPGTTVSHQLSPTVVMRMLRNCESKAVRQMTPCQPLSCQPPLRLLAGSGGPSLSLGFLCSSPQAVLPEPLCNHFGVTSIYQALCKCTGPPKEMRMPCTRVNSLVGEMAWRIHGSMQKHFRANIP